METQRASIQRLTVLLGLSAVWVLLLCAPALAHARFVSAEPTRGAELQQAPEQVSIRFSEPVEAEFSPLEVSNSQGGRVDQDNARIDPEDARVVVEDLNGELSEGTYTVEWRVTSVDGHAIDGTYRFEVASAGAGTSQDAAQADTVAQADNGGDAQDGAGQQDSQETPQSTNSVLLYSAVSLGALIVIALAAVAVVQMRRRQP